MQPRTNRALGLTREEWATIDWLEGRQGRSWHAYVTSLIRQDLARRTRELEATPVPNGFGGVWREED